MLALLNQMIRLALLLGLVVTGIWYAHTHWVGYEKKICNPAQLAKGRVCLKTIMDEWKGNVLWVDARSQDAFERSTIPDETGARHLASITVIPLRNDSQAQKLLTEAMPYLLQAETEHKNIVVFCDKSCNAAENIAEKLKDPSLGIDAPIYVLEDGWDSLRRDARFNAR